MIADRVSLPIDERFRDKSDRVLLLTTFLKNCAFSTGYPVAHVELDGAAIRDNTPYLNTTFKAARAIAGERGIEIGDALRAIIHHRRRGNEGGLYAAEKQLLAGWISDRTSTLVVAADGNVSFGDTSPNWAISRSAIDIAELAAQAILGIDLTAEAEARAKASKKP